MNIFSTIEQAEAISIEGMLTVDFTVYSESGNDDKISALNVEVLDEGGNIHQWVFRANDLEYATFDNETQEWIIEDSDGEPTSVCFYRLEAIV